MTACPTGTRSCLAWIPALLSSPACQLQKEVRIRPVLTRGLIPQMCCSYTKNPTHSPKVAVGAPLVSGGPRVTAGSGGDSEQAHSRWLKSRTCDESHKIIPFSSLHCWLTSTPILLRGLFFLLPTKHSKSLMAYCILQGLELQHQLKSACASQRYAVTPAWK